LNEVLFVKNLHTETVSLPDHHSGSEGKKEGANERGDISRRPASTGGGRGVCKFSDDTFPRFRARLDVT
jgi:hypothetical protein